MADHEKKNKLDRVREKLIAHFDNSNSNEAQNAFSKATELLRSVGLDWRDFTTLVSASALDKDAIANLFRTLLGEKDTEVLVRAGATYFHVRHDGAYADIPSGERIKTYPLDGDAFSDWLIAEFYHEKKKAPKSGAIKDALRTLSAHDGSNAKRRPPCISVAPSTPARFISTSPMQNGASLRSMRTAGA